MRSSGCNRPCRLGRRGGSSLEFALVGSLVMALTLGAADLCRYLVALSSLRMAGAEVARAVTLAGGANLNAGLPPCTGLSGTWPNAGARVRLLAAERLVATLSGCQTHAAGVTSVTITLSYGFRLTTSAFGVAERSLSETTRASFN